MPHHRGLELFHWDLHLLAPRPDPGGGVIGEPADDLGRGAILGRVVGSGDLRVQRRGQRPGLRTVDHHLNKPQAMRVRSQATLRLAGVDVVASHPPFVRRPVQRPQGPDCTAGGFPTTFPGGHGDVPGC